MPTLKIPQESPLHEKLVQRIKSRHSLAEQGWSTRLEKWRKAEEVTLAYMPETEADAVRKNRRDNGKPQYTTIQLPYSFAVLMSAHTYWTSVFFARSPVHQFSGMHGEGEMQIQAVEALINYQVESGMLAPYYIWLYDSGKYGCGILGHYWAEEKIHYGELVELEDAEAPGTFKLYQTTKEVSGYKGNRSYNVSPYDFMHDPRVALSRFQDGEFCFVRRRMGWNDIVKRRDAGFFMNIDQLRSHQSPDRGETLGSDQLERPIFNKEIYDDIGKKHPAGGVFWEMYVELIPKEWGLGTTQYPQKWCLTVTEDLDLLVGASPLGYIHGRFPFDVLEPEVEGYGLYNRGLPEIMEPIQHTMDWLINSHFFNVRAAINNQFIIDPSKLVIKDAQKNGPGFIWRLRPEAYGQDVRSMVHQVPVSDVTRGHMGDLAAMLNYGERISGINDQIMGALSSTNRKTATEVRTTTGFGVNRQKTVAEYMSATGFSPHARKLIQSSQQFYDAPMKLRIAGDFAQQAGAQFLDVTPDMIAGMFNFVPVDGTLPVDRMAQANLWKEILGGIAKMPAQIQAGYDWGRIFAWVAPLGGLKNINQFRVQVVPDGQLQQQAAAGNVIPMRPPQGGGLVEPGNSASTAAGLNALGGEGGSAPAGY